MIQDFPETPSDDLPPISPDKLRSLFDALDRSDPEPCTPTHAETTAYLRGRGLPLEPTLAWLQPNGAGSHF